MPLQRITYDVFLAPAGEDGRPDFDAEPLEYEVQVRHQDQLRGEMEGAKNARPNAQAAPMVAASLWAWAALTRTKQWSGTYREFEAACHAVQGRRDGVEQVDPTQPDTPSGTPSPSPPTSVEDPATGSTPS